MSDKILIVDDEKDVVEVIKRKLTRSGYDTLTALDGLQALDIVEHNKCDLILTDVIMPRMDGCTFCQKLAELEYSNDVPIIVLSGSYIDRDFFMNLGIDQFLYKPCDGNEVLAKINYILHRPRKLKLKGKVLSQVGKRAEVQAIVEDARDLDLDIEMELVDSGMEMINATLAIEPNVVILDLFSRDISAMKMVKMLRRYPQLQNLVILLSVNRDDYLDGLFLKDKHIQKRKEFCLKMGASGFVDKVNEAVLALIFAEFCLYRSR